MRPMHIVDQEWENSLVALLGVFLIAIVAFALMMAGF
jgi:hypothetical protein